MKSETKNLYIGSARSAALQKTVDLITGKLLAMGDFRGKRLLDVGCGDGTFTRILGTRFDEVFGIDVQEDGLESFRASTHDDPRFFIENMSASELRYPDISFDTVVTIETLEHVPDLAGAAKQIARVLKSGGELLITVPNRWFPFENHGIRIGRWEKHGRIPLLTYFPWLHQKLALARVFTVAMLDGLFIENGFSRTAVTYAWPTFEHGGNSFQPFLKPLYGTMRAAEVSPLKFFGSSVIVRYVKR